MEEVMRKVLTAALAALTLGGAMAATAVPAQAAPHGGWGGHGYHGGGYHGGGWGGHGYRGGWGHRGGYAGPAIVAGVAGLALGAALADRPYYGRGYGYNGYGYEGYPAYGYGYAPGYCQADRWVWDPYAGRNVLVRQGYPC
jgi:opacity protein-like surface antigen